jgi:hypothetical protein
VQLPQVSSFLDTFLEPDDRWQRLKATPKWRAYRRMSEGSLVDDWSNQAFFPVPVATRWERTVQELKASIPLSVRQRVRRLWVR